MTIKARIEREYEYPRSSLDQKVWAEAILDEIQNNDAFHDEFRLKRGSYKRFIEEALPIARMVAATEHFRDSIVILRKGYQRFDAEVQGNGGTEYIEVVNSIDGHKATLVAQLLNKFGFAPYSISRPIGFLKAILGLNEPDKYVGDVIYASEEFNECTKLLISNIQSKIEHGYTGQYHLLATYELDLEIHSLSNLIASLKSSFAGQIVFCSISIYERRSGSTSFVL